MDHSKLLENDIDKFVHELLTEAINRRSSDIHIENLSDYSRIRFRIDGLLIEFLRYDNSYHRKLVTKLKLMSGMNISQQRLPQDGRMKLENFEGVDFRCSSVNTVNGEKFEIRILSFKLYQLNSDLTGFLPENKKVLERQMNKKGGLILFCGPTGSGKTTSLYSLINKIDKDVQNVVTVEDPVEYRIEGINQIEVNDKIGLSFNTILRSILRQDPDILLIGEIRDTTAARIAIRAALTGHLVLSTLHTNDAISAIMRLKDLGIEDYLINSTLKCVVSQRLIRKLCGCKKSRPISKEEIEFFKKYNFNVDDNTLMYEPKGCEKCYGGYLKREASEEVLIIDESLKEAIKKNLTDRDYIMSLAKKQGFRTILQNSLAKVLNSTTSLEEVSNLINFEK